MKNSNKNERLEYVWQCLKDALDEPDPLGQSLIIENESTPVDVFLRENMHIIVDSEWDVEHALDSETAMAKALLNTMPRYELEKMLEGLTPYSPLWYIVSSVLNPYKKKNAKINEPIGRLIKEFESGQRGRRKYLRDELMDRFDAQSHRDQIKIFRALLNGTKTDRDWCYRKGREWWDDALLPDLKKAWETYHDPMAVRRITERLPIDYVREHQGELGEMDYYALCLRLGAEKDFTIDRMRMKDGQYLNVMAHHHLFIEDDTASYLLFGYIGKLLSEGRYPSEYHTKSDQQWYGREDYQPSLLYLDEVELRVWALGQTGNTEPIKLLFAWEKDLHGKMKEWLETESVDYRRLDRESYFRLSWRVFALQAILSFPLKNDNIDECVEKLNNVLYVTKHMVGDIRHDDKVNSWLYDELAPREDYYKSADPSPFEFPWNNSDGIPF